MSEQSNILFQHTFFLQNGIRKCIRICHGDLCETTETYDILVCSAYKNSYHPYSGTLIGNLYEKKKISVEELAENPDVDLREYGCWVSHELKGTFRRLACVELLSPVSDDSIDINNSIALKSTFSTLRFMLEELSKKDNSIRSIALPILGSGNQKIELCYIVPPLLSQCSAALENIPQLESITFYEINYDKANVLKEMCENALSKNAEVPHIFISYSTKQQPLAYQLKNLLLQEGITCWMAPESIPAGSSYQAEIPSALNQIPVVLLILSPEAENSRWVQKEIGCTIGARHTLIPYMNEHYTHTEQFNFLLDGEQIFEAYKYSPAECEEKFLQLLCEKLNLQSSSASTIPTSNPSSTPTDHKSFSDCSDFELLDFLTHCAFDPNYTDRKYLLDSIRNILKEELH